MDKEAFGELFDRYHDSIFAYILHRTADLAVAQDLTAETFFRALRNLDRFRWNGRPFSAWLYRIASSQCTDHHRRSRVRSAPREIVAQLAARSDVLLRRVDAD